MEESQQQRPHLLAIPFPAQGHINPMLELCKRIASGGVLITFLVSLKREDFESTERRICSGQFLRFVYLRDSLVQATFAAGTSPFHFVLALEDSLKIEAPEIIRKILEDDSLPGVSGILTDVALVGIQDVARDFGIPKISLSTFSASWHCIQNGLDLLKENGLLPVQGNSRIIDFIPGLPELSGQYFPWQVQEADLIRDPDFSLRRSRNDALTDEDWVFINSFRELETSQFNEFVETFSRFRPIGPLLPSFAFDVDDGADEQRFGFWEEDPSCLNWLDEQPPRSVLYVSFGSLASASTDEIRELYSGLIRSGYSFLWVLRSDNSSDVKEVLLDGDGDGNRCRFVSWAPQLKVLKHPSVAAFLTHCGWNSVLEAVVAGVPILGWPFLYEQPLNCALAVEVWGIGRRLPARVECGAVAEAVEDVMGEAGQEWRNNVLKLSVAAKDAVSAGGASECNLSLFLKQLKNRS